MELLGTGNFLRSAEMEFVSMIVQEHLAHDCIERLGDLGVAQFSDLNGDLTSFKRFYTPTIRRCDDMEKKLAFFEDEMAKHGVDPEKYPAHEFQAWIDQQRATIGREHRGMTLLEYWQAVIDERHRDYCAIKAERDKTASALYGAVQRRHVLERASDFFVLQQSSVSALYPPGATSAGAGTGATPRAGAGTGTVAAAGLSSSRAADAAESGSLSSSGGGDDMAFRHVAGILASEDKARFARIVFRASSGHAMVRFSDVPGELVDAEGEPHAKTVFAIFFRGRTLVSKLDRICSAFSAHQHDIPSFESTADVASALDETKAVISDAIGWLEQERATSATTLRHLALLVRKWRCGVGREKALHHVLNMVLREPERGTVYAQAWVLKSSVAAVHDCLAEVHAAGGRAVPFVFEVQQGPALPKAPTHFPTNRVTRVFHGIVSTYGVPRYREANPALFAVVTFPFLFGVMYGDVGHGSLLTCAGAWMVWNEASLLKQPQGEIFGMAFKGRYAILMMGCFAVYCGLIYNDLFSLGITGFGGSKWVWDEVGPNGTAPSPYARFVGKTSNDIYPVGIDPAWHNADNELLFFNSLKMKMSVILGVTQMTFGLLLKVANAVHFGSAPDLYLEALPQVLFLVALFGYMLFLIFYKWGVPWPNMTRTNLTEVRAPASLIDVMINIALKPGYLPEPMFPGQAGLQSAILLIVFLCVPVMLLGKPLWARYGHHYTGAGGPPDEHETKSLLELPEQGSSSSSSSGGGPSGVGGLLDVVVAPANGSGGGGHGHGGSGGPAAAGKKPAVAAGGGGHGPAFGPPLPGSPAAAVLAHGGHIAPGEGSGATDDHGFGEAMIHQGIETIEFVLGSVSNTASYLRLWALSLAHSQLATVFWERTIVTTIEMNNAALVVAGYATWAAMTFGVLMLMDVLECFLHVLRLHWVEFQNKFYKADGYKHTPFSFTLIDEALSAGGGGADD